MRRHICLIFTILMALAAMAQHKNDFAINAQFGYETIFHKGGGFDPCGNDHGYSYDVNLDYYTSPKVALNGGVYAEQQGVFTGLGDGLGLSTNWLMGIHFGVKYYLLSSTCKVQPFIGGTAYLNFLGLRRTGGTEDIYSTANGGNGQYHYVRQNTGGSIAPQVGVELRLTRKLAVTLACDFRLALYGYNHTTYTFYAGKYFGKVVDHQKNVNRCVISLGLKYDLSK